MIELKGIPIPYQVQGKGAPLVLVHGLAGSTSWWVRNVGVLSRKYQVYLVDLPGFGAMRRYRKAFSVAGAAEWLAGLLTALDLPRVSMLGHSMGGLITAIFAARWPERLNKIVLAAPAIALAQRKVAAFLVPFAKEFRYLHPSFLPTLVGDSLRAGVSTLLRVARELLSMDITQELEKIVSPALLLWGQRDPLVPLSLAKSLQAKIHGSELYVLPDAGHILMYDRAAEFNRVVLSFLEGS